jgi:hypothetical protein
MGGNALPFTPLQWRQLAPASLISPTPREIRPSDAPRYTQRQLSAFIGSKACSWHPIVSLISAVQMYERRTFGEIRTRALGYVAPGNAIGALPMAFVPMPAPQAN